MNKRQQITQTVNGLADDELDMLYKALVDSGYVAEQPVPAGSVQIPDHPAYYYNPATGEVWSTKRNRYLLPVNFYWINLDRQPYKLDEIALVTCDRPQPTANSRVVHINGKKGDCRLINLAWRDRLKAKHVCCKCGKLFTVQFSKPFLCTDCIRAAQ